MSPLSSNIRVCVSAHRQAFLSYGLIAALVSCLYLEMNCSGLSFSSTSNRNKWRENNVVRNLYRRVRYLNHRPGNRRQHAPCATEVDWCRSSLSGRRRDHAWCDDHSTKGSIVLRVLSTRVLPVISSCSIVARSPCFISARFVDVVLIVQLDSEA